ncbi:Hypp9592 [Branchiostoma lanceolatum]|uniref:Hypp9592 protein n=1 Tax=Branchiostoma lanceolatum TaxID=7740 RepID=A0A8S4MNZ2_BRALA|nr:Hypp9592 [Branchiostoma lanceolatum]
MKGIRDVSIDSAKLHDELASLRQEIADLKNRADPAPPPRKATYAEAASDPLRSSPQVRRVPPAAEPICVEVQDGGLATVPKSLLADASHKQVRKEPSRHSSRTSRRGSALGGPSEPGSDGFQLIQKR